MGRMPESGDFVNGRPYHQIQPHAAGEEKSDQPAHRPTHTADADASKAGMKAAVAVQLALYVNNINLSTRLTRDELRKLTGVARFIALNKTTLVASILRLRKHPRESAA